MQLINFVPDNLTDDLACVGVVFFSGALGVCENLGRFLVRARLSRP